MSALVDRLAALQTLAGVPRAQLEWLASHGELQRFEPGQLSSPSDVTSDQLFIVLKGRVAFYSDRGGARRKVMEWKAGDITGMLPYSRMTRAPGDSVAEESSEALVIKQSDFPEMIRECYELTALLVHIMLDRARHFTSYDLRDEKMKSLGRLSAGLAHELNNPASAVARNAASLAEHVQDLDAASRALGAADLSPEEAAVVDSVRGDCLHSLSAGVRSPMEQADREDAIGEWLEAHGADADSADPLAESAVTIEALDRLAAALHGPKLNAALRAIAAGCTVSVLAEAIETAALRISGLVAAVKGFTYMDQSSAPAPVDLAKNLSDTIAVHQSKAKSKSIGITVKVDPDLPRVLGSGGELNQVWGNLIENALDAAPVSGHVAITARRDGPNVAVSIEDDGHGVPEALRSRIFEPFFTTKPVGSGTGLGLDISRRIVDQHGGDITLESRPGRTVFTVTLPAVQ